MVGDADCDAAPLICDWSVQRLRARFVSLRLRACDGAMSRCVSVPLCLGGEVTGVQVVERARQERDQGVQRTGRFRNLSAKR